jgi:hypothetical protein
MTINEFIKLLKDKEYKGYTVEIVSWSSANGLINWDSIRIKLINPNHVCYGQAEGGQYRIGTKCGMQKLNRITNKWENF